MLCFPCSLDTNNSYLDSLVFFLTILERIIGFSLFNSSLLVDIIAPLILQSGNLVIEFILSLFKFESILKGDMK